MDIHKCVLAVKELHESHGGAHMEKVLHEVLVDYNLTNKVRIFFMSLRFCTKYLFSLFCIVMCNHC